MTTKRTKRVAEPSPEESRRESGMPGGGQGRIDAVGRSGVYPGSGPYPGGPAELRTPAEFAHGQIDAEGRSVEGGSELIYFEGKSLLGGATPLPSGSPAAPELQAAERTVSLRKPRGAKLLTQRNQPEAGRGEEGTITKPTRKPARRAKGVKA